MAYLSLYRKYRPQTFSEILGQEHVSQTLANAITENRIAHAYLFTGPRGTGKTSTARILAKALNCEKGPTPNPCGECNSCVAITGGSSLDVIEMDAASHSKVDETREILAGVPLATAGGLRKVYVIDEVHMLSTAAFNALLKTLEEPPPHVVFVLATTEAHKVLPTIVSRTQRFDFRRVPTDVMEHHLAQTAKSEEIDVDEAGLSVIARNAEGSVRDALSVLDQLASLGGSVSEEDVENLLGKRAEDAIRDLFDSIAASDVANVFQILQQLVSQGADVRQLALNIVDHARSLLLLKTAPNAEGLLEESEEDKALLMSQAENFTAPTILRILDLVSKAVTEMRNSPEHRSAARDRDRASGGSRDGPIGHRASRPNRAAREAHGDRRAAGSCTGGSTARPARPRADTTGGQATGTRSQGRGHPGSRSGRADTCQGRAGSDDQRARILDKRSASARSDIGHWPRTHQGRVAGNHEGSEQGQQARVGFAEPVSASRLRRIDSSDRGPVGLPPVLYE